MQKVIQHLMDLLTNHLSSEDKAYRRQIYLRQVGAPEPNRGLSTGAAAADRAPEVASHQLKHYLNRDPVPEQVDQQVYLHPYPKELMLRNHVQPGSGISVRHTSRVQDPRRVNFVCAGTAQLTVGRKDTNEYGPVYTVRRFPDAGALVVQPTTQRTTSTIGSPLKWGRAVFAFGLRLAQTLA